MPIQRYELDECSELQPCPTGDLVYFEDAIGNWPTLAQLKELFELMDDHVRLEWLDRNFPCCHHCGSLRTNCQCWNDV